MPNHCENEVYLHFPTGEAAMAFKKFMHGKELPFDFNSLVPEPKVLLEQTEDPEEKVQRILKYGHDHWYEWRMEHWETGWDCYECDVVDGDIEYGDLTYLFQTAWGPPEGVYAALLKHLATNHPDATVSWYYREPLMQMAGYLGVSP